MSAVEALQSPPTTASLAARDTAHGLYERHAGRILGFCIRRLDSREEAEDAVQTVFVNALRALQRGVVPISEEAWLFKIAENVCRETHRSNGRRRQREVAQPENLPDPVANGPELGQDVAKELVDALGGLPVNQRRALLLREWRGLSYREIASELRVSVGAVETLIFRARRNMAQALSQTKSRIAGLLDLGSVVGALKTAFSGSAAVKLAAAAAVVTVAALPAGDASRASTNRRVVAQASGTQSHEQAATPTVEGSSRADKQITEKQALKEAEPAGQAAAEKRARAQAPSQQGASASGESPAAQSPVAPVANSTEPLVTPPTVHVPPPPAVQLPQVPELPQVPQAPQLPELPSEVQLPELPAPPELPVQPPAKVEIPELPKLP